MSQFDQTQKTIFLILGRTGSGKSSLAHKACKDLGLVPVKSYTTRPMRENETPEKSDHIFIQPLEVAQYEPQMAAWTEINGYEYFTTFEVLDASDVYIIDPDGLKNLKQRCGDKYNFVTIYINIPSEMARIRTNQRGHDFNFDDRYIAEDKQFTDYEISHNWDYCIENATLFSIAADELQQIIITELRGRYEH